LLNEHATGNHLLGKDCLAIAYKFPNSAEKYRVFLKTGQDEFSKIFLCVHRLVAKIPAIQYDIPFDFYHFISFKFISFKTKRTFP
jgi:hypothetical protein